MTSDEPTVPEGETTPVGENARASAFAAEPFPVRHPVQDLGGHAAVEHPGRGGDWRSSGRCPGRSALREVESERLIELRESQKRAVEALFREVTNSLIVYSGGFSVNEATTALTAGFDQLANATITPAQQQSLVNYYDNDMIKPIKRIDR